MVWIKKNYMVAIRYNITYIIMLLYSWRCFTNVIINPFDL